MEDSEQRRIRNAREARELGDYSIANELGLANQQMPVLKKINELARTRREEYEAFENGDIQMFDVASMQERWFRIFDEEKEVKRIFGNLRADYLREATGDYMEFMEYNHLLMSKLNYQIKARVYD